MPAHYNASMAMIHVNRSGTTLGTFSEDDVRAGLRSGRLLPTDLGWREGMPQWQPLSQFAEFAADIPAAAAAAAPGAPPGAAIPQAPPVVAPPPSALAPRSGLPWDNRQQRGFIPAFFDTMVMILTKPAEAFTAMRREGGFGDALIYGLIGGCFGYVVSLLFLFLMPSLASFGDRHNALAGFIGMGFGLVFCIIMIPVFVTVGLFIGAAIVHVCLMIVGGAKQPFETTFRVLCFALGSTYPLIIVPFCGSIIAGIWGLVAECIGLARAHETDTGRAVLAVFLPVILCCGFAFIAALMIPALVHHSSR
jgi:hypothetical protein